MIGIAGKRLDGIQKITAHLLEAFEQILQLNSFWHGWIFGQQGLTDLGSLSELVGPQQVSGQPDPDLMIFGLLLDPSGQQFDGRLMLAEGFQPATFRGQLALGRKYGIAGKFTHRRSISDEIASRQVEARIRPNVKIFP